MEENRIYSFIGLAKKAGAVLAGEGIVRAAIKNRRAFLVIMAKDASPNTKRKIETALFNSTVTMLEFGHKENLGHMLGKAQLSVIAITDGGFAGRIKEMVEQVKNNDDKTYGGGFFE
ncbi:MAG: L7Ae/L30e/S12e/Gadd45 family ribosomal protein [Acetivibrionales bacterium]|jgi:ribosomal protein L7Ae-like RNA K-turn-binding protein|nr:50S ribosomal protein L7ae [Clostridiaceae bacterium]